MSYNESLNPGSNYPEMTQSQWDSAPWNEKETPEKEFEVCITQTLSKTVKVTTNDYIPDGGIDDDGHYYFDTDTSDTDWKKAYKEEGHSTPLELLRVFKSFLHLTLDDPQKLVLSRKQKERLIEECENWIEDETEIVEE